MTSKPIRHKREIIGVSPGHHGLQRSIFIQITMTNFMLDNPLYQQLTRGNPQSGIKFPAQRLNSKNNSSFYQLTVAGILYICSARTANSPQLAENPATGSQKLEYLLSFLTNVRQTFHSSHELSRLNTLHSHKRCDMPRERKSNTRSRSSSRPSTINIPTSPEAAPKITKAAGRRLRRAKQTALREGQNSARPRRQPREGTR
jgi:hypothetical protein